MTTESLTQKELKEILHYSIETGIFTRKITTSSRAKIGSVVGNYNDSGYLLVSINRRKYRLHRLAFLYMTGKFPVDEVDHINRARHDNSWHNLRCVTRRQNSENTKVNCNFIGVGWIKCRSKWRALSPKIKGKKQFLGEYKTHLAACYARHYYEISNPT